MKVNTSLWNYNEIYEIMAKNIEEMWMRCSTRACDIVKHGE